MAQWRLDEALSDELDIDHEVCHNLVDLIDKKQCTLPFIARYRKQQTKNIPIEKLRSVFETLDHLKEIQNKVTAAVSKLEKSGVLNEDLKRSLQTVRSTEELDILTAPYKSSNKKSLAARAAELGLVVVAKDILNGETVNLKAIKTDPNGEPLSHKQVTDGVKHSIADVISKDIDVLKFINNKFSSSDVRIQTTKRAEKDSDDKSDSQSFKYKTYFDFNIPVRLIKPHQVLAINRAESLKYLSVKVMAPDLVEQAYTRYCEKSWKCVSNTCKYLFDEAVADAYKRLLLPMLSRKCRTSLKKDAEERSVSTFGDNLKCLLLQPPCNEVILGIDPGFSNGCKMAVISKTGEVLDTVVAFINSDLKRKSEIRKLTDIVKTHRCPLIAIGNGTGCRQAESVVSDCISSGQFAPVKVKYCIVNEDGSSIYSTSKLAEEELPLYDQNLRSAVSIARRLQDPLVELVKIDPQHIGVGMYQHDIPKNKLKLRLDSILSECVSFVGVDVNIATEQTLSHVAGLNMTRAKSIIAERRKRGSFICREQLLNIKGLGAKTPPENDKKQMVSTPKGVRQSKKPKLCFSVNPLDQTMIHPQSYVVVNKVIDMIGLNLSSLGSPEFITAVNNFKQKNDLEKLSSGLDTDEGTLMVIFEALGQPINKDIRDEITKPLFHDKKTCIDSLKVGDQMSGVVRNVTDFGAFVDIGVQLNGLLHISKMRGREIHVGTQVNVRILSLELSKKRIGLDLVRTL